MNEDEVSINCDLSPESAESMGLEWCKDTIFDPEAPIEAMRDVYDLVAAGYILGMPASVGGEENGLIGVYKKAS